MPRTVFSNILQEVVADLPEARGVVFVDWEGEMVDSFSYIPNTTLRLFGAHWGIVYYLAQKTFDKSRFGSLKEVILNFDRQTIVVRRITDEYLVIIVLGKKASLGRALERLDQAEPKLREEMM